MTQFGAFDPSELPEDLRDEIFELLRAKEERGEPVQLTQDDLPPMTMMKLAAFIGAKHSMSKMMSESEFEDKVTDHFMPGKHQLALEKGDYCLVTDGLEGSFHMPGFTIVKIENPEEYVTQFPDWQDRILKSYVLCSYWTTQEHDEPQLGWFSRISLVPLPEEHFQDAWEYMLSGTQPEDPPVWMAEGYIANTQSISEANNNFLPTPLLCRSCDSTAVLLRTRRETIYSWFAGHDRKDPTVLRSYAEYGKHVSQDAQAVCFECGHSWDPQDDGFRISLTSNNQLRF